ncbi:hypothetical protein [Aquibacillus sediminis]|uniref:hypothetical protein n=1 Tax=Aquibacillus sediminis TaxID=2574734 RepID=UPI001108D4F0|nr:hypothetical protein [Aquibacillus sediminis]
MKEVILLLADIVNELHDALIALFDLVGFELSDKDLHFWIMGAIGIVTFFVVHFFFKLLEKVKWNITIFSFIYTFTVMIVLVFAIEIQQAITNRGNMEFADAVIGLWGFIVFFFVYAVIGLLIYFIRRQKQKRDHNKNQDPRTTSRMDRYK